MADLYCDHGAYATALGTTPTWGVPQEGDGSAPTAAAASSVGSVLFGSVPTTGGCNVFGAVVTLSGVLGAASVDAAADALAASINATQNPVTSGFAAGTPQLRNLVYARGPTNGAPAGTCQIMSRIGSASLNVTGVVSTFDGTPTITQFTGGSGGCWGWFLNTAGIGVGGSIAAHTYGAWLHKPMARVVPTVADTVWMRTGGGASKLITIAGVSYNTISASHDTFSTNVRFDTNTKWADDIADGQVKVTFAGQYSASLGLYLSAPGCHNSYHAMRVRGLEIEITGSNSDIWFFQTTNNSFTSSSVHLRGVRYVDAVTSAEGPAQFALATTRAAKQSMRISDCEYAIVQSRTFLKPPFAIATYGADMNVTLDGCLFDFNISGIGEPGPLLDIHPSYPFEAYLHVLNCRFIGYASGYTLASSAGATYYATTDAGFRVLIEGTSGLKLAGSYLGLPTSSYVRDQSLRQIVHTQYNDATTPGMRVEDARGVIEWLPNAAPTFPTLASTVHGIGTPWSLRALWLSSVILSRATAFSTKLVMSTQLVDGSRIFTLELLLPSTVADGIEASFSYKDTMGVPRSDTVDELTTSAVTWTGSASFPGYVSKKLTISSSYPVEAGSEVVCLLRFVRSAPSAQVDVYIDPEFKVE